MYSLVYVSVRAVGRSENPGVPVLFGGHNLPPLVEIGLTDLPKFGGAMAPGTPRDDRPEKGREGHRNLKKAATDNKKTTKAAVDVKAALKVAVDLKQAAADIIYDVKTSVKKSAKAITDFKKALKAAWTSSRQPQT